MFLIVKQKQVLLLFSFSVCVGAWRNIAAPPTLSAEVSERSSAKRHPASRAPAASSLPGMVACVLGAQRLARTRLARTPMMGLSHGTCRGVIGQFAVLLASGSLSSSARASDLALPALAEGRRRLYLVRHGMYYSPIVHDDHGSSAGRLRRPDRGQIADEGGLVSIRGFKKWLQ